MDPTTCELLLGAVANGASANEVSDLYGALSRNSGGPTSDAVRWFNDHQGKKVEVKGTRYVGIVHELNESVAGIYNGGRYPIYVKLEAPSQFDGKSMAGKVYEYAIEQLEVVG